MKNCVKVGTSFDCDNWEKYKKHKILLGESDVACLTMTGMKYDGVSASVLKFGADGEYTAWVVDDLAVIPERYKLVDVYSHWLKIYDDTELVAEIVAKGIRVYRAGATGCLIYVKK